MRDFPRFDQSAIPRTVTGKDLQHWQPDELRAFVEHADSDDLAAAWRLTACGLTRADVLGLRWSDIDLDTGVVTVSQGRVALGKGDHTDDPKSVSRRRALPVESMWPGTVSALRSLRVQQAADKLRAGTAWADSGYVVVDALGQPVRPEWYSDRFRAVGREAGLPSITLHAVRHSLAFWLHREGVTPADAAGLLGHTVQVHLDTYLPHSGASGIASAAHALGRAAAAE
jgi:integrase